jgi:tetratricopeptide (TPR) repeat protein
MPEPQPSPPAPPEAPGAGPRGPARGCLRLVGGLGAALIAAVGGLWLGHHRAEEAALEAQAARAEAEYGPARTAMREAAQAPAAAAPVVDLDQTVRVIHEIDGALRGADDMGAYLQQLARHDYRGVDPEVLAARAALMDVLVELYKTRAEADEQAELWGLSSQLLLSALSVVKVQGDYNGVVPKASVRLDADQARALLADLQERQDARLALGRAARDLEGELIDALVAYSRVYHDTLEAWDRLCTVRDRAYLATRSGDWAAAEAAARQAIAMAPTEREAHLLLALALIEGGDREDDAEIGALLDQSLARFPHSSAPALLLRGVHHARRGRAREAQLDLEQAAAYYPRQAEVLADLLDPYAARGFLQLTAEGSGVLELYRATMLGAGWFSPDLQIASLYAQQGRRDEALRKVLDHFHRRRGQGQWDAVLADIDAAQVLLGDELTAVFPEAGWLDLQAEPALLGDTLGIRLQNRSSRTLHNATLVLALQLTDMHPQDYKALRAGETVPAVNAHEVTTFGDVPVSFVVNGEAKGVDQIVAARAVLVADEAVVWVDTEAYRIAQTAEGRRRARADGAPLSAPAAAAVQATAREGRLTLTPKLMGDEVRVALPDELAALRPVFRLKRGDAVISADTNLLQDDHIELTFRGLRGLVDAGGAADLELIASTAVGELVITFAGEGLDLRVERVDLR